MDKPFAVLVSDRSGHWDEWLVGAESKDEAIGFVRGYWLLNRKKIVALDLTNPREFRNATGIFGTPKVVSGTEGPHFLPVPAASGIGKILRRASSEPTVGVKQRVVRKHPMSKSKPVITPAPAPKKVRKRHPDKKKAKVVKTVKPQEESPPKKNRPVIIMPVLKVKKSTAIATTCSQKGSLDTP